MYKKNRGVRKQMYIIIYKSKNNAYKKPIITKGTEEFAMDMANYLKEQGNKVQSIYEVKEAIWD